MEKTYDILYKGRRIYKDLTIENCSEVFEDLSQRYYLGEDIDLELLEMEESTNG
jgi:hypothetical protein